MADLIKFAESSSIGLHAMLYLAAHAAEGPVQMRAVAAAYHVSEAHLSKVMQRLGKAGLVTASRGPNGGYTLCKEASEVTLLEVYEALEGPIASRACLFGQAVCEAGCCELGTLVGQLQQELRDTLARTTLADWRREGQGAGAPA